jgi:hypothetical protein
MSHEGWSNYPTWAVNLWLSNDEPLYRETVRQARQECAVADTQHDAIHELAAWIRELVSDGAPHVEGLWADLLSSAIGEVDWWEISTCWIQEEWSEYGPEEEP